MAFPSAVTFPAFAFCPVFAGHLRARKVSRKEPSVRKLIRIDSGNDCLLGWQKICAVVRRQRLASNLWAGKAKDERLSPGNATRASPAMGVGLLPTFVVVSGPAVGRQHFRG